MKKIVKSRAVKKAVSILLMCALMMSVFVCAASVSAVAATEYRISTGQELYDVAAAINTYDSGTFDVYIDASFETTFGFGIRKPVIVNIFGEGNTITFLQRECNIGVNDGATVNLGSATYNKSLVISGKQGVDYNDTDGLVVVWGSNSVCNMYENVTIKDHSCSNSIGSGVSVINGEFHMYGGTIDNCGITGGTTSYGGGVSVCGGGLFVMDDGLITNCYATTDHIDEEVQNCYSGIGGGVYVTSGSTFTMNGGTISNCSATNFGGGVAMVLDDTECYTSGANEYVDLGNPKSKLGINKGTITNNTAKNGAGVFASGYFYSLSRRLATLESYGVGTPDEPGVFINGGANKDVVISSNTATGMGGGVLVTGLRDTRKAQIYNACITNNTATSGAGVENYGYWTQLDIDGCTISGNEATSNGGGITASGNSDNGYTAIKNTTITGNTSGDRGAGVYYDDKSEIRLSGADVIQDNTYNGTLNNLNILSLEKPVKVVGDLTGSQIGLSDPTLWDDGKEDTAADAVSTIRLTDGYKDNNADLIPANAFTSDHESWYVDFGELTTKTVASEDDFYTYNAQKYGVVSRTDSGESRPRDVYTVKANTFSSGVAENPNVFKQEVLSRFSDTSKYQLNYDDGTEYDYIKLDTNDLVAVYFRNEYNAYIYYGNYSYPRLITSTRHQTEYAESGTFAYQYYTANSETIVYSDDSESVVYHDSELLDSDKTIYDYDELGYIISKTVVNKTPTKTPHQETTIELRYDNEVRLVRKTTPVKFHTNNPKVEDETERNNELFRIYNAEVGNTDNPEDGKHPLNSSYQISEFYNIPAFAEDDYVFAGWYYHTDGDKDGNIPFEFNADIPANLTDVYAHWIAVGEVNKDGTDDKVLPNDGNSYRGFGLFGVQIRPDAQFDHNMGEYYYGGLRFISSVSESLLSEVDALSNQTVNGNKVEYGYVTAAKSTIDTVANAPSFGIDKSTYKIQYNGENVNGIDTTQRGASPNNFRYVTNVDCTSQVEGYGSNSRVKIDHGNFDNYRLMTFVVNYTGANAETDKAADIVARAYMRYYDANGLLRTFYNDYGGTTTYGGCCTSFNTVNGAITGDIKTDVEQ